MITSAIPPVNTEILVILKVTMTYTWTTKCRILLCRIFYGKICVLRSGKYSICTHHMHETIST